MLQQKQKIYTFFSLSFFFARLANGKTGDNTCRLNVWICVYNTPLVVRYSRQIPNTRLEIHRHFRIYSYIQMKGVNDFNSLGNRKLNPIHTPLIICCSRSVEPFYFRFCSRCAIECNYAVFSENSKINCFYEA